MQATCSRPTTVILMQGFPQMAPSLLMITCADLEAPCRPSPPCSSWGRCATRWRRRRPRRRRRRLHGRAGRALELGVRRVARCAAGFRQSGRRSRLRQHLQMQ